jgi:hypothetical protein
LFWWLLRVRQDQAPTSRPASNHRLAPSLNPHPEIYQRPPPIATAFVVSRKSFNHGTGRLLFILITVLRPAHSSQSGIPVSRMPLFRHRSTRKHHNQLQHVRWSLSLTLLLESCENTCSSQFRDSQSNASHHTFCSCSISALPLAIPIPLFLSLVIDYIRSDQCPSAAS